MNITQLNESQQEDSKPLISVSGLLNALRRQWLPASIVFLCVFGGTAYYTSKQKPIYEATGSLIFKIDRVAQLSSVNNTDSSQSNNADAPASNPISLENEVLAVRSASVVDDAIKKAGISLKRDEVLGNLKVDISKGTDILTIAYKGRNAKEVSTFVNQLMNSYTNNALKVSKEEIVKAKEFVQSQIQKVGESLMKSELELRNFKEKNAIAALAQESSNNITTAAGLRQKILDVKVQLNSLDASSRALKSRLGVTSDQAVILSRLSGSEAVKQTLAELQKVEAQLALQRTQYQEEHPSIKRLQRQKSSLQALLQQRVDELGGEGKSIPLSDLQVSGFELNLITDLVKAESTRVSLQEQLVALNEALNGYTSSLKVVPQLEQQQQFLERKILIDRTTYESLLKRLQELQLAENRTVSRARILSEADVPTQPVSPKVVNNLLLGGVLGLALAIATALGLQSRDKVLRTTDEVRRLFGYNLLGVLPNFGKKWAARQAVFVRSNPRSPISEAYRTLQTNLRFRKSDSSAKGVKVIVVTSSIAAEGKSTVAANLAATTAQLGRRALLIDADMRRPSQQLIWNIANTQGLSDLIAGKISEEVATQKSVMPNLDLLLSGTIPSNPLSLLDSNRMTALMKNWSEDYDFVIIDTPPLLAVADAMVLGNLANGILLVARPDLLNSNNASRVRATLEQSGMVVLGMVVNAAVTDDKSYYEHQYDYVSKEEPSSTPMVG
ncbi:GumC family protein [Pseudanabaena sp. PCC 6802]|uniref:GumC family protein n=1 Tax=Pseudanabaena sp. PCC 6802 TaxID=118173 RepID=UPI00034A1C7A|nr:polysaccharide biosynthesis tyrosine autokinase [Pseudanabaena sp. PCC 6802]